MDIKSENIYNQENIVLSQTNSDDNLDLKPKEEENIRSDNISVKKEISNAEKNFEEDSRSKHEPTDVKQESDIEMSSQRLETDDFINSTGIGDVKTETKPEIKSETVTNSGDAKPESDPEKPENDPRKPESDSEKPESDPEKPESDVEKFDKNEIGTRVKRKCTSAGPRPSKRARVKKEAVSAILNEAGGEQNEEDKPILDVEYCLTVTNLPNSWSFMDIKNYIDTECGPVDEIEMLKDDKTGNGAIKLSYQTGDECEKAMKKLEDKEIEGTRLTVSMSVVDLSDSDMPAVIATPENTKASKAQENDATITNKPWKPDLDMWEIDPKGTYGLKEDFLKSLGITPPLDKWVHVSNFRCDKIDLRDVLEMAGNVLMCSVFNNSPKYANVMFSHPLEAVQAVSMLNGQNFYGQPLKVTMERSPSNTVLLAKGLNEVGTGLGANGKPLRSITKHYQRYVTNQTASVNRIAFEEVTSNGNIEDEEFQVKKVDDFNYVVANGNAKATQSKTDVDPSGTKNVEKNKQNKNNSAKVQTIEALIPSPARSPMRQQAPQNFQPRNGPNFGGFGPRPGPVWSASVPDPRMQRPFGPGPGPRPAWNGPGPMGSMGPMGGPMPGPRPMGPMGGPMPGPRPMGPMQGPMPGPRPMGPMQGPMQPPAPRPMQPPMQGPMQGPMPGPMMGPMQGPMGPGYNGHQPVQLHLSNLPPTTTFALLCDKMAACGQVVSIQFSTPGAAVVTFANRMQADRCFQSYNNVCIEGYVIQVKYT